MVLARSIFHQGGASQFEDQLIKKTIIIMKTTKKILTPKNHFIIAFGNRTDAGDTVHLQPR